MISTESRRGDLWAWAVFAIGLAFLYFRVHDSMFIDLGVYRMGGDAVLHGLPVYEQHYEVAGLPFTYPPFAALLFAPISALPWTAAIIGWAILLVVGGVALVRVVQPGLCELAQSPRLGSVSATLALSGVLFFLEPFVLGLSFGQVNVLIALAVYWDCLAARRAPGVATGLVTGVKLTPGIFILLMPLTGRWRSFWIASGTFAATIALGFLVLRDQAWAFWTDYGLDSKRVGGVAYAGDQNLHGFVARTLPGAGELVWLVPSALVVLLALWVATRLWERSKLLSAGALAAGALLGSPISWSHHYVIVTPLIAGLIALGFRTDAAAANRPYRLLLRWVGAAAAVVLVVQPIWWVPNTGDVELTWSLPEALAGNSYVLVSLGLLSLSAMISVRPDRFFAPAQPAGPDPRLRGSSVPPCD
jgi:alpha-1,2-mannosyltransferase